MSETEPKRPKTTYRNVCVGTNPTTGVKYYERRRVALVGPSEPPEEPPTEGLLTEEELKKKQAENDKSSEVWNWTNYDHEPQSE